MSTTILYTDFDGKRVAIRDLARLPSAIENGIDYPIIYRRYRYKGIRGADLIAPLQSSEARARMRTKPERENLSELAEMRRQAKARKAERKERYITALAQAREAHEREFSRPLISAKLLSHRERTLIRERVKGVQRWWPVGGAR